ncbi:DUF11 domain-containing protein, partial [Candidatus Gracilibacteria bacterium]|nr:DUF11 domain-containing protein [Candidatus Gracilibacteria bacterium]
MKYFFSRFWLLCTILTVCPLINVLAGQGDFYPSRPGITSSQYPNGLNHNEFNLFTDDSSLANKRRGLFGTDKENYKDERDFVAAAKGECRSTVASCATNGQPFSHSITGLQAGDKASVHVYFHNNAQQDAGYQAQNTTITLDWSSGNGVLATISADNISGPNPISDFVDIGLSQPGLKLRLPGDPNTTSTIIPIGNVAGSYAFAGDLIVNFEVIQPALPAIQITKTANPVSDSTVNIGNEILYTLTIKNTGNVTLPSIIVTDSIQTGLEYVPNSASNGGTVSNGIISFPSFSLSANASVTRSFKLKVITRPGNGKVCNSASVSNTNPVVSAVSGQVCHNVNIPPQPGLSITKSSTPLPNSNVNIDDTITYILTISNTGNVDLTGVSVSDIIQAGLQYVSNPAGGTYNASTNTLTFTNLSITKGTSITRSFFAKVISRPANGKVCNAAFTNHSSISPNPQSQEICHNVNIPPQPGLSISKTSNPLPNSTVNVGDTISYTLTIQNTGTQSLDYVIVSDPILEGLQYIPGSASNGGSYSSSTGSVSWAPFSLSPNQ